MLTLVLSPTVPDFSPEPTKTVTLSANVLQTLRRTTWESLSPWITTSRHINPTVTRLLSVFKHELENTQNKVLRHTPIPHLRNVYYSKRRTKHYLIIIYRIVTCFQTANVSSKPIHVPWCRIKLVDIVSFLHINSIRLLIGP